MAVQVKRQLTRVMVVLLISWAGYFALSGAEPPSALDILAKMDKNMVYRTAYSEVEMNIVLQGRTISKSLMAYAVGNEKSFIEFLAPARDKGTKILKVDDVVKVYYPSAERVLRLSGHMLRQSMMGSDFSFEDMTERSKKLREEYNALVLGDETINGKRCFVLELTAKLEKQTYYTRKIWVDQEQYLGLKEELYAKSGKLLKVMLVTAIKEYQNRVYPVRIIMTDKLRQHSQTEMIITKIEFDVAIADELFSERQLMKK